MKFILKTVLVLLISAVPVLLVIYYVDPSLIQPYTSYFYYSPCDHPIHYRIGNIDAKFDITPDTFAKDTIEATTIWSSNYGKQLFVVDPQGPLTVNLVYDQRQYLNSQINNLQGQLNQEDTNLKPQIAQYKQDAASFKQRLANLNNQIEYWNARGGAPSDEYDKLIKEQNDLQVQAQQLNAEAEKLNQATDEYNVGVDQLHQQVNQFNTVLQGRPEEGLYIPASNQINIYFNNGHDELVHTLAHEFGHALGMDHLPGYDAIMYAKSTSIIVPSAADIKQLQYVCRKQSYFALAKQRIMLFINLIKQRYNK